MCGEEGEGDLRGDERSDAQTLSGQPSRATKKDRER